MYIIRLANAYTVCKQANKRTFICIYRVKKSNYFSIPLPLGAWDGLRYFIVALTEPSI